VIDAPLVAVGEGRRQLLEEATAEGLAKGARVHHEVEELPALRQLEGQEHHVPCPAVFAWVLGTEVVVQQLQGVGVGGQALHRLDLRVQHLQHAARRRRLCTHTKKIQDKKVSVHLLTAPIKPCPSPAIAARALPSHPRLQCLHLRYPARPS
jgi:hypothetical protein